MEEADRGDPATQEPLSGGGPHKDPGKITCHIAEEGGAAPFYGLPDSGCMISSGWRLGVQNLHRYWRFIIVNTLNNYLFRYFVNTKFFVRKCGRLRRGERENRPSGDEKSAADLQSGARAGTGGRGKTTAVQLRRAVARDGRVGTRKMRQIAEGAQAGAGRRGKRPGAGGHPSPAGAPPPTRSHPDRSAQARWERENDMAVRIGVSSEQASQSEKFQELSHRKVMMGCDTVKNGLECA